MVHRRSATDIDEELDANTPVEVVELLSRKVRCLNFVLLGNVRSGTHGLQSALTSTPDITCHENLLHQESEVRDKSHIGYFGDRTPTFDRRESGASQYLDAMVFDRPLKQEKAVGVRITYDQLVADDLFDFLHGKQLEGDFCAIHIVRNPLVCLTSQKQAQQSGIWRQDRRGEPKPAPKAVYLTVDEVVEFVRHSAGVAGKLKLGLSADMLEISYTSLYTNFPAHLRRVCEFLNIPALRYGRPSCSRLRNTCLRRRIANYDQLMAELPEDVLNEIRRTPCL